MENTPHIVLKDITKIYKGTGSADVTALNGVSLEIPHGQFLSIMGPSGSGKSTLLHIIGGLTNATKGTVSIDGTLLNGMSDRKLTLFRRKNIGVVVQAFNLISTLTAEENIMLPILAGYQGEQLAADKLKKALDELLGRLQLTNRRHHYPDALSGGEQQRVAIARALLIDFATDTHGSLLLADEPTGNLDSTNGDITCRLLRTLCDERHHTMVVVTHEPSVAAWTDRIVTLKDGRILSDIPNAKPGK